MNNESIDIQDVSFELKKIIDDIDNIKLDVDIYAVLVEEKILSG